MPAKKKYICERFIYDCFYLSSFINISIVYIYFSKTINIFEILSTKIQSKYGVK